MAKAQAGGPGWTTLVWSDRLGRLINQWSADHAHALAGGAPILALDMYEHAYHLDFGARAAAYVDAVMGNLHWERIAARYRQVRHGEAEDVALFTPFGRQRETEMLISAEDAARVTWNAIRRHCWMSASLLICRAAATCCRARRCTIRTRSIAGLRRCRAINRSSCIAFSVSRSAATPWRNCAAAATTRAD